ncbi:MAG: hypothetical protein GC202_02150 [Alphaproteobacteria bacterium]|nr:hypothetical protein [Alphaproteobacteria bacterium]
MSTPRSAEDSWTPAQIDDLTRLWNEGLRTAEIGARLGKSKNAAVGKAHRLGLPPRPNPIKRAYVPKPAPVKPPPERLSIARGRQEITFGLRPDFSSTHLRTSKVPRESAAGVSSLNSTPVPVQPLDGTGVLFGTAATNQCAWPLWNDDTPRDARRVCGCKVASGADGRARPFCMPHVAVAWPRSKKPPVEAAA